MKRLKRAFFILILLVALMMAFPTVDTLIRGAVWLRDPDVPTHGQISIWGSMSTKFDLHQIGIGLHNIADIHSALPAGGTFDEQGRGMHSWMTMYGSPVQNYFMDDLRTDEPWNSEHNAPYFRSVIPEYLNASLSAAPVRDDEGFGLSHFASNQYVMGPNLGLKIEEITDGTSTTLLVGEVNSLFQPWGAPTNWRDPKLGINTTPRGFGSHPDRKGALFAMADGSVEFVSEAIDSRILEALTTPDAGDSVPENWTGKSDQNRN
ncbi:MAG TPA: DUF1559 domain-containing protein [Planctomycetaceae bacterium]|nr:DUF1559 domain-containing protein [Planctomycetaceae bacterium]